MDKFPEIPDYRIEKTLGRGRLADVFLAVDEDTRETVVLKVLRPELIDHEKFAKRFLYEFRKAAKLEHPNIAEILDVGETPDHYYLVMEYFRESLRDRLNKRHPGVDLGFQVTGNTVDSAPRTPEPGELTDHEILDIFRQLFDAVDYAHIEEAVHRDIRPENIFFREDGTPVLADFHTAELVRASDVLRKMAVRPNMPHYTSPEQALKKSVDKSSDIYSLGITLYEVLTGTPPYDATEAIAIENQHVMEPIPHLPEQYSLFQPLIDRMMAKSKEDRADNGAELILFMEELSDQLPESNPEEQFQIEPTSEEPVEEVSTQFPEGAPEEQFQIESTAEAPMEELPVEKVQVEGVLMEVVPVTEKPVTEKPVVRKTRKMAHIDSVDDLVKISTMGPAGELGAEGGEGEDVELDLDLDLPPVRERTHKFKVVAPGESGGIAGLLERLRDPKVFIPVAAGIVIVILLIIFFLPSGGSGESASEETEQAREAALTPEEKQERNLRYTQKFKMARRDFKSGRYQKALLQANAAEKIKSTEELKTLKKQIEVKITEKKDDDAFAKASGTDTAAAYEEYLSTFSTGRHAEDARKNLGSITVRAKKREAQRRKWAASRVRLRTNPQILTKEDVRAMLNQRGFFEKYYNKTGNFLNHYELLVINTHKVVVDYATGLMWLQSGSKDYMKFNEIQEWVDSLNRAKYAGFSDWRVPTLEETTSLLESKENRFNLFIDPVFSRGQKYLWTCDTFSDIKAWIIDYYGGDVNPFEKTVNAFVRPVRSNK